MATPITLRDARLADCRRILEICSYYVTDTAISFEYTVPSPEAFQARMEKTIADPVPDQPPVRPYPQIREQKTP